jgi:hypothetical protein
VKLIPLVPLLKQAPPLLLPVAQVKMLPSMLHAGISVVVEQSSWLEATRCPGNDPVF